MKTPRQILFERSQSVEPKLDNIRQKALVGLTSRRPVSHQKPALGIWELLLSLRWHLAAMSAAWLLVGFLNAGQAPNSKIVNEAQTISSPGELVAAIRENRRELMELLEISVPPVPPAPRINIPRRRSEFSAGIAMV